MDECQGGSTCQHLMMPGHHPLQVCARPRRGSFNQLRRSPRPTGQSDVLRVAFIPGDEEAVTGRSKSSSPPPVNRQGPDGAKSTDFVVRAENGGKGLDMDDGGRVPWRLVLVEELVKETTVGNRSTWLRCHI